MRETPAALPPVGIGSTTGGSLGFVQRMHRQTQAQALCLIFARSMLRAHVLLLLLLLAVLIFC